MTRETTESHIWGLLTSNMPCVNGKQCASFQICRRRRFWLCFVGRGSHQRRESVHQRIDVLFIIVDIRSHSYSSTPD